MMCPAAPLLRILLFIAVAGSTAASDRQEENLEPTPSLPPQDIAIEEPSPPQLAAAEAGAQSLSSLAAELDAAPPEELVPSLLRIAQRKHADGRYEDSQLALYAILELRPGGEVEVETLLQLADTLRALGQYPRAAAILEKVIKTHPASPRIPQALLNLGRVYRQIGASKLALARFYAVLNSTLKLSPEHLDEYQLLARTAQFEIAETHLHFGRFADASEYFRRLSLLELAPEDRARAQFKSAYAVYLSGDYVGAARQFRRFLKNDPQEAHIPEALYLLSLALERRGLSEESLSEALKLFDTERYTDKDTDAWHYWQRRAGNHLANEFFTKGHMSQALQLYSELAAITPDAEWRAPALYQVGLSAERLGDLPRARDAYSEVIALAVEHPELEAIAEMAAWRRDHIDWTADFEASHGRLVGTALSRHDTPPTNDVAQQPDADPPPGS